MQRGNIRVHTVGTTIVNYVNSPKTLIVHLMPLLSPSQEANVLEMQQLLSPCCFILEKLKLVQSGLLLGALKDGFIEVVNAPLLPPIITCRMSPVAESQKLQVCLATYLVYDSLPPLAFLNRLF